MEKDILVGLLRAHMTIQIISFTKLISALFSFLYTADLLVIEVAKTKYVYRQQRVQEVFFLHYSLHSPHITQIDNLPEKYL